MPTQHTTGLITTSTGVPLVGMSPNGTPVFVTKEQAVYLVSNTVTVLIGGGSTIVTLTSFTGTHPGA
jgi:hypothetical protein